MKKVYCKHCKYLYRPPEIPPRYKPYGCSKKGEIVNNFLESYLDYPKAEDVNENNDCENYERNLWKFWIR